MIKCEPNQHIYDSIVIGSGPAGCTAAVYLKNSGYNNCLIFTGPTPGGLLNLTSVVENYTGFKNISGADLVNKFIEHASSCVPMKYEKIVVIENIGDNLVPLYKLLSDNNQIYYTKTVIIASGSYPRELGPEKNWINRGVSYCAICDGMFFRNQVVAVVGGGNSAFEEALYLANIASQVILIHRSDKFRAFESIQRELEPYIASGKIKILKNTIVNRLDGSENLESINVTTDGKTYDIKLTGLFVAIGYNPNTALVKSIVKCDENGYIIVSRNFESSLNGLYGCGDVIVFSDRETRYKQAVIAAGEGCHASLEAAKYLSKLKK